MNVRERLGSWQLGVGRLLIVAHVRATCRHHRRRIRRACPRPRCCAARRCRVTLLDRRNHHLFQPLLYQVATATLSPGDIAAPIRWMLRHAPQRPRAARRGGARSTSTRGVSSCPTATTLDYDYLIVAHRREPRLLRSPRVGAVRAGPEDARGRARDPAAHPARVRARRARDRSGAAAGAADVRARRRRSDRRRAGRHARGDRAADAARRIPLDRHAARARIVLVEAGPTILPAFPEKLRDAAREVARAARRRGARDSTAVTAHRRAWRRGSAQERLDAGHRALGRRRRGVAARRRRSVRRSIAPDACSSSRICRFPVIRRSSSSAMRRPSTQDGQPLPGVAQVAMQQAAHAARDDPAQVARRAAAAVRLSRPRQHGDRRPRLGDRRPRPRCEFSGPLAWLVWLFLHIFMLIGFRNRLVVHAAVGGAPTSRSSAACG